MTGKEKGLEVAGLVSSGASQDGPPSTSKDEPIALSAPDGRVFAYACPRCLEVGASVHAGGADEVGMAERAGCSREQASKCCRCRECGGVPDGRFGRFRLMCAACERREDERQTAYLQTPEYLAFKAQEEAAQATFTLSPNPEAAQLLGRLMSDISEDHWCAGWMHGCEFALWRAVVTGEHGWGLALIEDSEVKQLRLLSEQSGGWVVYGDGGREFVPLAEWQRRYDEATSRG